VRTLEGSRWVPRCVSHMGCVGGCLKVLGLLSTPAWLFGATGHAFVIHVHHHVCPSGPTTWNSQALSQLGRNVGYETQAVSGTRCEGSFAQTQARAWDFVKHAIDQGLPCYGRKLNMPEYYVVFGYDDTGY